VCKRHLQGILFPEGVQLENGQFRTTQISPILRLIQAQNEALINSQATLAGHLTQS